MAMQLGVRWRRLVIALAFALAGWSLLAASGQSGRLGWIAELPANFPLIVGMAAAVATGLFGLAWGRWGAGVGVAGLAATLILILLPSARLATASGHEITWRIAAWNTFHGRLDPAAALEWIEANDPDVIAFTEITKPLHKALMRPLRKRYPYQIGDPRNGVGGLAVFSKIPLSNWQRLSRHTRFATFEMKGPAGESVATFLVHPPAPTSARNYRERADLYETLADQIAGKHRPAIVLGDFNGSWASLDFRRLCRAADLRSATEFQRSWPAGFPAGFQVAIDHVLVDRTHFLSTGSAVGTAGHGSDHLPVLAEVSWRSDAVTVSQ